MEIVISPKFKPLFQILEARNKINSKGFKKLSKEKQQYWVDLSKVTTVLLSGGRDSGKSFSLSCFNVLAAKDYNHRILYTRQTMSSTDKSITGALENRMEDMGVTHLFESANNEYKLKDNSKVGKISITGQKTSVGTQTAKLKSLEGYSIFETDEGEELESFDGWNKIKRSMRAKDVQCLSIIAFNPPTREHWLCEEFYQDIPDHFNGIKNNILYIHTTYLDNGKDNMAEHNWSEYEELRKSYELYLSCTQEQRDNLSKKIIKAYKQYKFEILGGFKDVADGVVYEDWEIGQFNDTIPYCYGLDFGFNDPDALVKVAVDNNEMKVYVKEMYFKNNNSAPALMEALHDIVGISDLIIGDSAQKRLINDFFDGIYSPTGEWLSGVNIRKVRKSKGIKHNFVARGIKTIQGYTIVTDKDSLNVIKALKNYSWNDKKSGTPKHDWSDLMDAMRYGVLELINDYTN